MKLRNKESGKIREARIIKDYIQFWDEALGDWIDYESNDIDYLAKHWESCQYPKEYWYIDSYNEIRVSYDVDSQLDKARKEIGNYFKTEEEAEKAVEKLKALTEAKEDGLKIKGYYYNHEDLVILADIGKCNKLTLDTLFGKEID